MSQITAKFRKKIERGDIDLEVFENPMGDKTISFGTTGQGINLDSDEEAEVRKIIKEYKDIVAKIAKLEDAHDNGDIDFTERIWEMGRVIYESEEEAGEDKPSYFPNNKIVGNAVDMAPDTLSAYKVMYEAFPDKGYDSEAHTQSEIREFVVQIYNKERGRRGYDRYLDNEYTWERFVRRAWCNVREHDIDTEKETIRAFAEELEKKRTAPSRKRDPTIGADELVEFLQQMIVVSDTVDSLSEEDARELVEDVCFQ